MKKIALAVCSSLISILVFAAGLELILRQGLIANPQYDRLHIQGTQSHARQKLLILGDSFITGRSVAGRLLARDLAAYNVAVLNEATGGTGPFEYLEELKAMAPKFKPDIVLLSYYTGNDLTDVQNHPRFDAGAPRDQRTGRAINTYSSRPYLRDFYVYHYLLPPILTVRSRLLNYREMEAAGIPADLIEDAKVFKINPWLLAVALYDKNYFLNNILMETDANMRAWEKAKRLLAEIDEICKRQQAQLVLVIFPASVQVNESHFEFFKRLKFKMDLRTLESAKPQTLLREFCGAKNIPCLNLLPAFKARRSEEFFVAKDTHLNDAGNRLAAKLILEFLLKNTVIG